MAMVLRDLVHELDPRLQQRTRLRRVGGLAILDWWLTTTGALALVPLMSSVEDLLWSWVLFAFVVRALILLAGLHDLISWKSEEEVPT